MKLLVAAAVALLVGTATDARAQGFVSPFIGYDFAGASGCPSISGCQDKKLNVGASVGVLGDQWGFEEEFGYAKDFFGASTSHSSSVFTMMGNLIYLPKTGTVRPYVLAGLGLMQTHVEFTTVSSSTNNNFAWDAGGGVTVLFSHRVGVRGDIRYLRSFEDLSALGLTISQSKLDFARASLGLVVTF